MTYLGALYVVGAMEPFLVRLLSIDFLITGCLGCGAGMRVGIYTHEGEVHPPQS